MDTKIDEFTRALASHAPAYDVPLDADAVARLAAYYLLLTHWNARLHLVAPCTPTEFATRHVLESLVALRFMPADARFIDVGSGGGLPAIPCLVGRTDLHAILFEAATKKTIFLREALTQLGLRACAEVRAERFEKQSVPAGEFVTCRALERFSEMLPQLVSWATPARTLLLFGGPNLRDALNALARSYKAVPLPLSDRRYLYVV